MSRSRKRFAGGTCCGCRSQKKGKQFASRRFRRLESRCLSTGYYERLPMRSIEITSPWDLGGDGKTVYTFDRFSEYFEKWTRK